MESLEIEKNQSKVVASTDSSVVETQQKIDALRAGASPVADHPPKRRRARRARSTAAGPAAGPSFDLGALSGQLRGVTETGQKLWGELTESDDILARAAPYVLLGAGIVLGIARFIVQKKLREESA